MLSASGVESGAKNTGYLPSFPSGNSVFLEKNGTATRICEDIRLFVAKAMLAAKPPEETGLVRPAARNGGRISLNTVATNAADAEREKMEATLVTRSGGPLWSFSTIAVSTVTGRTKSRSMLFHYATADAMISATLCPLVVPVTIKRGHNRSKNGNPSRLFCFGSVSRNCIIYMRHRGSHNATIILRNYGNFFTSTLQDLNNNSIF